MGYGGRECRDCGAPIQFIQGRNGRWIPVEPGTEDRHRCQIERTCESCEATFKGAPWMKLCPDCYKTGRSSRSPSDEARPPRAKERLKPGDEDDVPF